MTCQLVELEAECYGEEEELVRDGHEQRDGEVVFVEDVDRVGHGGGLDETAAQGILEIVACRYCLSYYFTMYSRL